MGVELSAFRARLLRGTEAIPLEEAVVDAGAVPFHPMLLTPLCQRAWDTDPHRV